MFEKFEINKEEFGAFVAQLRKEKGFTQKELAARLFISDKAVSKWENAASIPDTTLLIPLAELLEVTVTELLMCKRMSPDSPMATSQVEDIVKTAITYSEEVLPRAYQFRNKWMLLYGIALIISGILTVLCCMQNLHFIQGALVSLVLVSAAFGAYFCFFAQTRLPAYYDERRVTGYVDGVFSLSLPGLTFNNRNWPHILQIGRLWSILTLLIYPVICLLSGMFLQGAWLFAVYLLLLALALCGLFVPMYVLGRKYA